MSRRLAALLLAAALVTARAHADTQQFATFDAASMEEDDENFLDHFQSRLPDEWRAEWEAATAALRTSQGCLTSGTWHQWDEFKARAPMTDRAWLDFSFVQTTDPQASWEWVRFDFTRATRWGTFAGRFQPAYDKSQQDLAALWRWGDGTRPLELQATFTFVDALNSFWEFRQARVGNHSEPYRAHPFEPELVVISRGAHRRLEAQAKWLTPSRKDIDDPDAALSGRSSLWGSHVFVDAEQDLARWTLLARYDGTQALSAQQLNGTPGDGRNYRRAWSAEAGVRRALGPRLRIEGRYAYGNRAEDWHPPVADAAFRGLDRMGALLVHWTARPSLELITGLLYDRIGITRTGAVPDFSYGTRKESRGLIGLQTRIGNVRLQGLEGIELDSEPYPVTFHHDKAYVQLQTTFR